LNIVLDDAVEEKDGGEKVRLGMVVCSLKLFIMLVSPELIAT
jgi:small nuclear ribonucleoprotein (snRNP)-like protein